MDYKTKNKVLNLRKLLFQEFFKNKDVYEDKLAKNDLASIDTIIAILNAYDFVINQVEDEVKEKNELAYYELEELTNIKEKAIEIADKLRNDIIAKLYSNKTNINNGIAVDLGTSSNNELSNFFHLRAEILTLSAEISNLKDLLKDENFKSTYLEQLYIHIQDMYSKVEEIYDYIKYDNEDFLYNNIDEVESNDFIDEVVDDEMVEDEWKNTSMFNYDISLIDDLYITTFDSIEEPQKILIGIMLSDFYEYHKVDKLFEFKNEENKDVLDTLDFIENYTLDENIQRFLQKPIWAEYIMDSYIYYNVNTTNEDKLINRMAISELKKLDILKKYNPYIDNTLKDETLYNMFITPINSLIRITNDNLAFVLGSTNAKNIDDLMVKYFTTNFLPNSDDYIPEQLTNMDINKLKNLQLKFLISDFIKMYIHENNEDINNMLQLKEDDLYKYVLNNKYILKGIIKNYLNKMIDEVEVELNREEKKKIYSINKYTILDI